ncbi:MAG: hypothetical protein ABEJ56_03320 [Candidatus Nanohaloarchaea archaeon]
MSERVDPFRFLEDPSPSLRKTLENPFLPDYGGDENWVEVDPGDDLFTDGEIDLENDNVHLWTESQTEEEGYTTLMYGKGIALVESEIKLSVNGKCGVSTVYYLVTDEHTLIYHDNSWEEVYNPTPREAARLSSEIFHNKESYMGEEKDNQESKRDPVPPPEEGDFTGY